MESGGDRLSTSLCAIVCCFVCKVLFYYLHIYGFPEHLVRSKMNEKKRKCSGKVTTKKQVIMEVEKKWMNKTNIASLWNSAVNIVDILETIGIS